jgi:hypothetical protein
MRRLFNAPEGTRTVVLLNLLFLLTVMLLPAARGLYATCGLEGNVPLIYRALLAICGSSYASVAYRLRARCQIFMTFRRPATQHLLRRVRFHGRRRLAIRSVARFHWRSTST